jgi:plastocyanin
MTSQDIAVPRTAPSACHMDIQHEKGGFTMKSRTLLLFALATLLGAAVAVLPALAASPSEAKLEVNENCVEPDWPCWVTPGASQPAAKVTVTSGDSVTFADSKTAANIAWTGAAPTCESTVPIAPVPPKTGWEGKCTFATPGTYKFESSTLWPEYTKYEVVVEGSATAPSTPTTGEGGSKGGSTPGTTTSAPAPTGESPMGSPLSGALRISSSQRGSTVKGSLAVSKVGAGGRLEVDLFAATASLAKTGHATQVVGRFVSASVSAGQRSFSVKLDTKARRALQRHHHLALKVEVTLTPANGEATSVTRSMTLHA